MSNTIQHFGVMGMHWGQRKSSYPNVSKVTVKMASNDAKRFVDAKMFFGDTAGTRRKLLKAELDKKKKTIPEYENVFNAEVGKVDTARSAKKAQNERLRIDTVSKGRSFAKKILNITGPLTLGVASMVYYANKEHVDRFVMDQIHKVIH